MAYDSGGYPPSRRKYGGDVRGERLRAPRYTWLNFDYEITYALFCDRYSRHGFFLLDRDSKKKKSRPLQHAHSEVGQESSVLPQQQHVDDEYLP